MKKYIIFCLFAWVFMLSAINVEAAEPAYINDDGDYETDVDKFIPQSRVYVKNSVLADKLENAAQKQLHKNNSKDNSQSKLQNKMPKIQKNNTNYKKSYKWF